MVVYMGVESAVGRPVETDILAENDEPWRTSSQPRLLTGVCLVGGNSAGEFMADIVVGDKIVGRLYCTESGAEDIQMDRDRIPIGAYVGKGSPVQLIVRTVSTVSAVKYAFIFKRWRVRRRFRRYRRNYRPRYRRY